MDMEAWHALRPWGRKELDTTERLNWTELAHKWLMHIIHQLKPVK